jgi:hypothetical protein
MVRYKQIVTIQLMKVRSQNKVEFDNKWKTSSNYDGHLDVLTVNLKMPCEKMPYLGMDESCRLKTIVTRGLYT